MGQRSMTEWLKSDPVCSMTGTQLEDWLEPILQRTRKKTSEQLQKETKKQSRGMPCKKVTTLELEASDSASSYGGHPAYKIQEIMTTN